MKTETSITTSKIQAGAIVVAPKPSIVVVRRVLSPQAIADDITSRITGRLVNYPDLFNPKTGMFLTENDLTAKGAVFVTVSMNKILSGGDIVKKGRTTGIPTPFIRKTSVFQMIVNIDWQDYVNRRNADAGFVADKERTNGVENYEGCRAIGITKAGNFTINGVAFRVLEPTEYRDENGKIYGNRAFFVSEFLKVQSAASKEHEAKKHGIATDKDPQYRTARIDNCDSIRAFGMEYIPTE